MSKKMIFILAIWLIGYQAAYAQTGQLDSARQLFAYDQKAPLDLQETSVVDRSGVEIHDINFVSPKGGRVTAYLVTPSTKGPHAGIIYGHWGNGNRTEFLPEAIVLARAGTVSVLIDYPWERTGPWWQEKPGLNEPEKRTAQYVQTVIDLRRAIDLLLARPDVDAKRIAYVGHSYGAQWGAILVAIDKRMKAAVLMAGVPTAASIWIESTEDAGIVAFRKSLPKGQLEKFVEVYSPLDAVRYVPHAAPVSLLFQFAHQERFMTADHMRQYAEAASQPKQVKWYDAGHELQDIQAMTDRDNWLRKELGLPRTAMAGAKK
jgi:dienelactone hydrolase